VGDWFSILNLYSNRLTGRLPRWLANFTFHYLLEENYEQHNIH
jgi:hypothetical protein